MQCEIQKAGFANSRRTREDDSVKHCHGTLANVPDIIVAWLLEKLLRPRLNPLVVAVCCKGDEIVCYSRSKFVHGSIRGLLAATSATADRKLPMGKIENKMTHTSKNFYKIRKTHSDNNNNKTYVSSHSTMRCPSFCIFHFFSLLLNKETT